MTTTKRVPWYSNAEWLEVYNNIFSDNIELKRVAVNRISSWEQKSLRVPIAISSTKLFVECYLGEVGGSCTESQLRLLYGSAIVRFVNTHVDIQQQKTYAESIATAANAIGIPSEIVSCRHQIVHNQLPSLSYLRHTASLCVNYLTKHYWNCQAMLLEKILNIANQSKHMTSGLIAILQGLDSMSPPKDIESSLHLMIQNLGLKTTVNVRFLLCAAGAIAGSKQKDVMKNLKRMNILNQPAFVAVVNWLSHMKKMLPRYLQFHETLLHSCSNEFYIISFLKEFALYILDPNTSYASVMLIVWTLARESPNVSLSLIKHIIDSVPPIQSASLNNPAQASQDESKIFNQSVFNREAFCTWAHILNVNSKELVNQFSEDSECIMRHLFWLKLFLLLPLKPQANEPGLHNKASSVALPLPFELFLNLFYNSKKDVGTFSSNVSVIMQDTFTRQLIINLNTMHSRSLSSCRAMLRPIAVAAAEVLFKNIKPNAPNNNYLKFLIQIINEADVKIPNSHVTRLIEWFHQKLLNHSNTTQRASFKKSVLQRFLSELPKDFVQKSDNTLGDQLHNIFWSIRYRLMNGSDDPPIDLKSSIDNFMQSTVSNNESGEFEQLSVHSTPWTNPGTTFSVSSDYVQSEVFPILKNEHIEKTSPVEAVQEKKRMRYSEDTAMNPPEKRIRVKPEFSNDDDLEFEEEMNDMIISKYSLLQLLDDLNNNFN